MKREGTEIHLRLKGNFFSENTHCETLKEYLDLHPGRRRSDIAEWRREKVGYQEDDFRNRWCEKWAQISQF